MNRPPNLTDAMLIAAMQAGDERAFSQFFRTYWPVVLTCAARVYHSRLDARTEDVAADVIADVMRRLARPSAPVPASIGGYLATAVRNCAHVRRRAVRTRERAFERADEASPLMSHATLRALAGDPLAFTDDPQPDDTDPRLLERVQRLERGLYGDQMLLLAWRAERVPYSAIGQWTGSTRTAATKRMQRTIQRARELLA